MKPMKKMLTGLGLATALMTGVAAAESVRIGTEGAYAPWNYIDDAGKLAGYEIELGAELCKKAGLTCEFVQNEWDSIIPNLIAGNYDMIMAGMSITDERKQTIDFSADYFPPDPSKYIAMKGMSADFGNLSGKRIGVQGATIQSAYAEETFSGKNTIVSYETPDQSVADLMAGNIDLLLADGSFLQPVVDGSGGAVDFVGPDVMIGGGVGIGMRKSDKDLAMKMGEALEAAKNDGTVDRLIKKYFDQGPFYQ